jgi:tripartite-type tricarboxylate transporter receptor subunit TctC
MRRTLCALLAMSCMLAQAAIGGAAAQGYPDKAVRVIVPFTPGGSTDLTGRIISEAMSTALKQPFVVENRPGAAATIGIDLVAKAKPDGYTLGVSGVGATAIVPLLDPKLPYSPLRDLDIIAGLSGVESVIVARPDLKQNSFAEVLAFAKDNPEKISYATAGVTGPAHLSMEDLSQMAKVRMLHVPFAACRLPATCRRLPRC